MPGSDWPPARDPGGLFLSARESGVILAQPLRVVGADEQLVLERDDVGGDDPVAVEHGPDVRLVFGARLRNGRDRRPVDYVPGRQGRPIRSIGSLANEPFGVGDVWPERDGDPSLTRQ